MRKRALLAAVFALVALVVAGCDGVSIVSVGPSQSDVIGTVNLDTKLCLGATESGGTPCPSSNWSNSTPPSSAQLLVAYRVPAAAEGPASVLGSLTTDTATTATVNFTRSDSYANEMQRLAPAASGEKWVGYISDPATPGSGTYAGADVTLKPGFVLHQGADGSPFQGPFRYVTVSGFRGVTSGQMDPAQSVSCGDKLSGSQTTFVPASGGPPVDTTGTTVCADDVLGMTSSPTAQSDPANAPEQSADVADAGVIPGPAAGTAGDRSVTVPFNLKFAGTAPAGTTFALAGSTHVPGATVTLPVSSMTVGSNSNNPVSAVISVPQAFTAGNYDVTLRATLPNGQTRSATATAVVGPSHVAALRIVNPTLTLSAPHSMSIDQFVRGFRVSAGCDIACSIRIRVFGSARSNDVGAAGYTRSIAAVLSKSRLGRRTITVAPCSSGTRSAARRAACRAGLRAKLLRNGTTRVKLLAIATSPAGKRSRSTQLIRVR